MRRSPLLHLACTLLATVLLAAPAAHAKERPILALDGTATPAEMADKGVKVLNASVLKGMNRVAVAQFTVEFVTADSVSTTTSGFAAAGRATSSLYYRLLGLEDADFQALADALHLDFLQALKASGLEVVSPEQLAAAPTWPKLAAGASPSPIKGDSAVIVAPPALGIYGVGKLATGGPKKGLIASFESMGAGFAAVGAAIDSVELAKELDAGILEVRLRVNFVQLTDHNRGFFGRLAPAATTSGKVFPSIDTVTMSVQHGPQRTSVDTTHALTMDSAAFSEVRKKAATGTDIAGAVAVGLLRLAIGTKDTHSTEEMEVLADPARYKAVVGAGAGSVGAMLAARLKSDR